MSLLLKGVARLSQLEIDADKDWQAKEMTNIKTIANCSIRWRLIFHSFHCDYEPSRPSGSTMSAHRVSGRRYINRL